MAKSSPEIDTLLQVLAVLVDRLGGEVVIGKNDFDAYAGVPVLLRNLSSSYILLRIPMDEESFIDAVEPSDNA
jgi:hypothetical protein